MKIKSNQSHLTETVEDNEQFFSTYDLGCSSALVTAGFDLISLDKNQPKKVKFIFAKKVGIEEAIDAYFSDKLKVSARTFFDNIKMIKTRLYSA